MFNHECCINRNVWWDSYGMYRSSLLACPWRYWGKLGRFSLRLRLLVFGKDMDKEYSILFGVYDFMYLNGGSIFAHWYNIRKAVPKGISMFTLCYNRRTYTKEMRSSATAEGASHFNKSSYHPRMYADSLYAWPFRCYDSSFSCPQSRTQGLLDSHFILVMPAPHPLNTWWSEGIKSGGQGGWGRIPRKP